MRCGPADKASCPAGPNDGALLRPCLFTTQPLKAEGENLSLKRCGSVFDQ